MDVVDLSSDEDKDDDDELVVIEELPRRTASVQVILDASEMFFFSTLFTFRLVFP